MKYKCMVFEGLDQVGKGDAVVNLSRHLSHTGYKTSIIVLPYYSTPFGYLIRQFLVQDFSSRFNIARRRKAELKMCLFALNRLEILNCILPLKGFDIYIFDRGPFSNALSIGNHIFENRQDLVKMKELVERGIYFDSYFLNTLNISNCLIYLKHEGIEWEKSRKEEQGDLYERKGVQKMSEEVYRILAEQVGSGWKNVVTKDNKGWRDREDIMRECMDFGLNRGIISSLKGRKSKLPVYLGIDEIQRYMYRGSRVSRDLKREWLDALKINDKKEVYRVSESISEALVSSTKLLQWNDAEIVEHIKGLVHIFPEIFGIIEYQYGKDFLSKFQKSLK